MYLVLVKHYIHIFLVYCFRLLSHCRYIIITRFLYFVPHEQITKSFISRRDLRPVRHTLGPPAFQLFWSRPQKLRFVRLREIDGLRVSAAGQEHRFFSSIQRRMCPIIRHRSCVDGTVSVISRTDRYWRRTRVSGPFSKWSKFIRIRRKRVLDRAVEIRLKIRNLRTRWKRYAQRIAVSVDPPNLTSAFPKISPASRTIRVIELRRRRCGTFRQKKTGQTRIRRYSHGAAQKKL